MNKKLMWLVALLAFAAAGPVMASTVTRTKVTLQKTLDASGNPLELESDKGWRVFEVPNTTTETQVTDENSVAPTSGILHKVCVESAPAETTKTSYYAIIWDSSAATGGATVTARRILPPIMRLSEAEHCVEIDAIFSLGLRVLNGVPTGSTYIYWRGLGDRR